MNKMIRSKQRGILDHFWIMGEMLQLVGVLDQDLNQDLSSAVVSYTFGTAHVHDSVDDAKARDFVRMTERTQPWC